jgi:hypothetical protein
VIGKYELVQRANQREDKHSLPVPRRLSCVMRPPQVLHLYLGDRFSAGLPNASYVWLPLLRRPVPGGGSSFELVNVDGWRLSDYAPATAVT